MPDFTDENEIDGPDDDLEQLRALAARVGGEPVTWEAPPEHLWERIAAEAGVPAGDGTDVAETPAEGEGGTVHPLARPTRPRRARSAPGRSRTARRWASLAAAAVVIVVGAVGVLELTSSSDDTTTLAAAPLELLGDQGEGEAELVDDDGRMRLRLQTAELDTADDDFLEVWVIDPDVTQLVSLGPLRSDGLYDLPAGLDPEQFPIVDVSVEPIDGDPTHSGDSVLRGQLEF